MKKHAVLIISIILGVFFQSCGQRSIKPSGDIITKDYDFTAFTSLDISNDFKAYVTISDGVEKVSIEADDNLHNKIVVEMNGNTLEIRLKDNVSIRGNETLNAHISANLIKDFEASDDSEIYLENKLETSDVSVKLSGDSKFDGMLDASNLEITLRGDSEMKAIGKVGKLEANLRGDSKVENYGFNIDHLDIKLAGDSEANLSVAESIRVKASGDSILRYKGDAEVESQNLSGDSELRKMD